VADLDWMVPLRADQGRGPSDLRENERARSEGTCSLSDLIIATGFRSDGQNEMGRGLTGERTPAARSSALEVYGDCSGDLLAMGESGRCAG
jgi:hypothetical protein